MFHKKIIRVCFVFASLFTSLMQGQTIPSDRIISIHDLSEHLKPATRSAISKNQNPTDAALATYFKTAFQNRFFYDWQTVDARFEEYNQLYGNQSSHQTRAADHISKFNDSTKWLLPFDYVNCGEVDAYALRHLARQHKMVDIAYQYFYADKDPAYIHYFTRQMHSLNAALREGEYEKIKDGNGIYEVFRSGYRVLNWLSIHNLFLGEAYYTDADQLYTVTTLLQHAAHLYEHNAQFRSGNHQTRGMSALAMLSILFRDFKDADAWYERSMRILGEHLAQEINADGFQFERSVHYHISDIANYFYVYQLCKINEIEVDQQWRDKLEALFTTLVKIAYPDQSAPVLQDDTDDPWAEKNTISGTMTLGYLLFCDPHFGYFSDTQVEDRMYWFLRKEQLELLHTIKRKKPDYGSLHFPQTGYYIMREGWNTNDKMMIISAGLDDKKPDHQHGDMLGIQAMANEQVILPNYQVRYSLNDYSYFKNSMVKNVALVDDQLQGKQWTGNKGGSGFGKFKELPTPKVIVWKSTPEFDLFVGSHNGFENDGIQYSRQVIYLKDAFWVVKDNFHSTHPRTFKQVWQGHYTTEYAPHLLRSTFANGSGFDILQLNQTDTIYQTGKQGKVSTVVTKSTPGNHNFITLLYPYVSFGSRFNEENPASIGKWEIDKLPYKAKYHHSISKNDQHLIFGVGEITINDQVLSFKDPSDLFITHYALETEVYNMGDHSVVIKVLKLKTSKQTSFKIEPGDNITF